ncbi:MAG: rhamnogalacturonan acetylesterase [Pirellulales bacterium]|nr:rhamnogalacturonan acetylesterase [Pirellulales bacterium]
MKNLTKDHRLWICLFVALLWTGPTQAEKPAEELQPIRIVVVGDSTVASYRKDTQGHLKIAGWGQLIGECFNDSVTVLNHAAGGRSSSSFVWEGRWAKAMDDKPDYVFIQFGHNDCPGKGIRYNDPKTSFRDNLRRYVGYARRAGAKPVLITPMTRRRFGEDGKIKTVLRPYAEAMLAVGQEEKVPVVDLHAASVELFNRLGDAGSADLSCSTRDRTHFSEKGARTIARLIAERLPEVEPSLGPYLKQNVTDSRSSEE